MFPLQQNYNSTFVLFAQKSNEILSKSRAISLTEGYQTFLFSVLGSLAVLAGLGLALRRRSS
jgi:hypothetical protein